MLGNSNQQGTILLVTAIIITLVSGLILEPRDRAWYPRALIEGDDARHLRTGGALGRDEWRDGMSVGFRAPARFYTSNWRDKAIDGSQQHQKRRMDRQLAYIVSPLSNQILEVGESLGPNRGRSIDLFAGYREEPVLSGGPLNECLTLRSSVQLAKDDVDKESGQIKRSCKGTVQVNRCEGSCSSSVQPSVRSHVGLKKDCFCCNEGSFKRVQVRLSECYSPIDNRRISSSENELASFMDIWVDEPTECSCRRCDSIV